MSSLFTKIIEGHIPSYKIWENDKYFAFLDIAPLVIGHTLVVPKKEVDYIFDLQDSELGEIMVFCKLIASALKKAIPCERIALSIVGLEIPHAHIHLLPINSVDDTNFTKKKLSLSEDEFDQTASKIRAFII